MIRIRDYYLERQSPIQPHIKYYDSKDGEEIFSKWWNIVKCTSVVACGVTAFDLVLYSQPKGYVQALSRFAFVGLPLVGLASAFVLVSNLSGSVRKKDDRFNWALGGATTGALCGVWTKRPIVGLNMAIGLGLLALIKKDCLLEGYDWFPDKEKIRTMWGNCNSVHYDCSLTPNRQPGYIIEN